MHSGGTSYSCSGNVRAVAVAKKFIKPSKSLEDGRTRPIPPACRGAGRSGRNMSNIDGNILAFVYFVAVMQS